MHKRPVVFSVLLAAVAAASPAMAKLSLPSFFSDHMVLQQQKPASIWGWADAGAKVTVSFAGQTKTATADANGNWRVKLSPMKANGGAADLTVRGGSESVVIHDVLVGEVWFASGQSNMMVPMTRTDHAEEDIAAANYPKLRMFLADMTPAATPQNDIKGSWKVASPQTVGAFSAVAYFFALNLHKELGVPVGIIRSAWGGKPCETFTSREALMTSEYGRSLVEQMDEAAKRYDPEAAQQRYERALARWKEKFNQIREQNKNLPPGQRKRWPRKPAVPKNPREKEGQPAVLYNGMIHPFVCLAIRGAIWYQGEANAHPGRSVHYDEMFPLMIRDWRKRWGEDFSFGWVQLANFRAPTDKPGVPSDWAVVQDAQRKTLSLPKTFMAVINDVGEANNIHPQDKRTVGARLARWALALDYGKKVIPSGPLYHSHRIEGNRIRITFDYAEGLKSRDGGPLKRFEIAGADRVWHWAEAKIDGRTVVVWSDKVQQPVAVRYAWADNPEGANLVNAAGLPASVFRTDDWPVGTTPQEGR